VIAFRFKDDASGALLRAEKISPMEIVRVASRGVLNRLREHFQRMQSTRPNAKGWPRQNFWDQVRRSTSVQSLGNSAMIAVNHVGIALRFFGGVVRPVRRRWLAIPANADAYGKTPREFGGHLQFIPPDKGGRGVARLIQAVAQAVSFGRQRKDGSRRVIAGDVTGGLVMFWLVKKTTHRPDPSVLPTDKELEKAAIEPAQKFIEWRLRTATEQKGGSS
jgi:hypothetical protein